MYTTKYLLIKKIDDRQSLLLNTLSGALDLIENRYVSQLATPDKIGDRQLLDTLRSRGYIYDSAADEERMLNFLFKKYAEEPASPVMVVCPTHSCNLRCCYCFEGNLVASSKEKMHPDDIGRLFKAFKRIDPSTRHLQLFGGEPLLPSTYQVVKGLIERAKRDDFMVDVVTNGVNVGLFIELFKRYKGIFGSFQITLDGPREIHDQRRIFPSGKGTFDAIARNISLLLNNGLRVSVRVNVDAQNIDYLPQLADIFAEHGWIDSPNFHCALAPVNDHKGDLDHANLLTEDKVAGRFLELRRRHVNLSRVNHQLFRTLDHIIKALALDGKRQSVPRFRYCESNNLDCYAFGADGYIYACSEALGERDQAIGKFRPKFELWPERVALWNNRSILTLRKCRDCNIATLCGGGCAFAALSLNGTQKEPVCQDAPKVVDSYLDSIKADLLKLAG